MSENSFSFENPPPVKNRLAYCWRVFVKLFCFAFFGVGSLLITIVAFPIMKLIFHPHKRFQWAGHHFISVMFRFFIGVMTVLGGVRVTVDDKKRLRNLKSCVVVANHPSLLDVVMMISQIPNANCIVNAYLMGKNILHIIAAQLYIPASLTHEEIMRQSVETLHEGNCLIIFPEGTRSLPSGQNPYKKGAARVALAANCPIIPVFIGGNDKRGLRKHDSLFKFNTTQRYHYDLHCKDAISPAPYKDLPEPAAAKRITQAVRESLSYESNAEFLEMW